MSNITEWRGERVLVTGGAGFLGSRLCVELKRGGAQHILSPRSRDFDLRDASMCRSLFSGFQPTVVFHLAAVVGGIGANRAEPGRFFHDNMLIGLHVVDECRQASVKKLVSVSSVCAFPKHCPSPFREADIWNGYPEETNAPYGVAKRALTLMIQAYRAQYGLDGVTLIPTNVYGPADHDDLERSHVVPALVRKFAEAKASGAPSVTCWGTGRATREFLHIDDCARALVLAAERLDTSEPINLGSGEEVSIRELAEMVASFVGYAGRIEWDKSKPDGQPRRLVDASRAKELLGWSAAIPFEQGLSTVVYDYVAKLKEKARA